MIDHTGFTVTDILLSKNFYTSVLGTLGYIIRHEIDDKVVEFGHTGVIDGKDPAGEFWLTQGNPSLPRVHIAFSAKNKDQVVAFYNAAMSAGGKENGSPGYRTRYHAGYYAAFILDPDGYNIEAVYHEPLNKIK